MKRVLLYSIIGAIGLGDMTLPASSEPANAAPRSLEQVRDSVRADAMTSLAAGDVQTVQRWRGRRWGGRRWGGPRYYAYRPRYYYGPRRYYPRRYYYRRPYYRPGIYFRIGFWTSPNFGPRRRLGRNRFQAPAVLTFAGALGGSHEENVRLRGDGCDRHHRARRDDARGDGGSRRLGAALV